MAGSVLGCFDVCKCRSLHLHLARQWTYSAATATSAPTSAGKVDLDKFTFTIDTINRLRSKLLATGRELEGV